MKVGFIVDGRSELEALPKLLSRLSDIEGLTPLRPAHAAVAANAPIDKIASVVATQLRVVATRNPDMVIVLWDREQDDRCAGDLARALHERIQQRATVNARMAVVVKDRMFENWLVAALPSVVSSQPKFRLSRADARAISPNKADNVDALALMKKSVVQGQYEKVADSRSILAAADVDQMAINSRSFRRFLRCLQHPDYLIQSKHPKRSVQ